MGYYYPRNISRLASAKGTSVMDMELMDLITFDKDFTNPRVLKIQIMVDNFCTVLINGKSEMEIHPDYGLLLEYTDMIIDSLVFKNDGVNFYAVVGY